MKSETAQATPAQATPAPAYQSPHQQAEWTDSLPEHTGAATQPVVVGLQNLQTLQPSGTDTDEFGVCSIDGVCQ